MNHLQKIICLLLLSPLFLTNACKENTPVSCNYAQELQDESTNLSNAATTYGQDPTAANCEAYRQAFLDYLDEADKLDNCVLGTQRDAYRQAVDGARASLDALTC